MAIEAITWQRYIKCGMIYTITRGLNEAATKPNSTLSYRFDSSRNTGQPLRPHIVHCIRIITVKRDPLSVFPVLTGVIHICFSRRQ